MVDNLRVLLVEDSEDDVLLLVRFLRADGYDVSFKRVDTRAAMEDALQNEAWDIIISDYNMPLFSMSDALDVLHQSRLDVPFIIVSGAIGEETAVEAMKAGAHDYIMKDNLARLVPAIERELREANRRQQRRQTKEDLLKSEKEKETLYNQSAVLAEIGRVITSSDNIKEVYENFADAVSKLIPFDMISISLIDHETDSLVIAHVSGKDVPGRRVGDTIPLPGTIGERVIQARAAAIAVSSEQPDDPGEFPRLDASWRAGLGSALAAPLISKDQAIGTLQFRSISRIAYNEQHIAMAENIATQISGAVANAKLYAEQEQLKEQLLHAQKMEAVGRLAGGIAHDFNNLLTPIMSYAQMGMMKLPSGDPVNKNLQQIYKAAESAASLISKLLSFSKRNFIEPRVINLNDLVMNIDSIARRLIGEDVKLINSLAPNANFVRIDPGQMEQVLMNLIVNSRDAMPNGGTITVSTSSKHLNDSFTKDHPDLIPGDYVALSVTDSGAGMSDEIQAHIFEPFYTTKMPGKGTGLGLSTCYGIIQQSQGHIEVESKLNVGTTIRVYLPLVDEQPSVAGQVRNQDSSWPTGHETILLVDDDPSVLDMASLLLRDQGYHVLEASDGVEALQLAKQVGGAELHLLLTDVVMPQMDGWELTKRLKLYHPKTKILYTSGFTDDENFARGVQEHSIEFIPKPYTPEKLAIKVREVLDNSSAKIPSK